MNSLKFLIFFKKRMRKKKMQEKDQRARARASAHVPYGFEKPICSVTVVASGGHMTSQQQQAEGINTRRWYSPQRTPLSVSLPAGSFQSCTTTREFHITGVSGHRVFYSDIYYATLSFFFLSNNTLTKFNRYLQFSN